MHDAPIDYVEKYYRMDCDRWDSFPSVSGFLWSFLKHVDGRIVLNAGCGPQYYDYMLKFAERPDRYVGLDVSSSTIRYLQQSRNRRFCAARRAAREGRTIFEFMRADIFDAAARLAGRFDCIVATGFIGTFHGPDLDRLSDVLRGALKPHGKLIKLTWHGPHRTPEQNREKLEYGYDSAEEHQPEVYLSQIADRGFDVLKHEIFECDPETYRWDVIQGCVLQRKE
ncbi:MAG: class I SAM-dependent methyltransferase [Pseudomonadota bacterium]